MAEAGTIDSLQIEIEASSKSAVQQINNLAKALKNLKAATNGGLNISNFKKELGKLGNNEYTKIEKLAQALQGLKNVKLDDKIGNSMLKIADACELIEQEHIVKLTKFGNALQSIKSISTRGYGELPPAILNIAAAVDSITDDSIARLSRLTIALSRLRGVDLRGLGAVLSAQNKANSANRKAGGNSQTSPADSGATDADSDSDKASNTLSQTLSQFVGGFKNEILTRIKKATDATSAGSRAAQSILQNLAKDLKSVASAALNAAKTIGGKFLSAIKSVASAAIGFSRNILAAPFQILANRVKAINDKLKNLVSNFKRILFYRAIRTVIKELGEAMKEGEENAYWYTKTIGDATHYIAEAFDTFASASATMKNQVGAAWATLFANIEPIITRIIVMVQRAAEVVTMFFAKLGGKNTYLKAIDYSKDWAEETDKGAKAAKEWRNQLMAFDEINRLESPTDSTSGSGTDKDYGAMFVEEEVDHAIGNLANQLKELWENQDWEGLGRLIGDTLEDLFPSRDKWKEWGSYLGNGIDGVIKTAYYALRSIDFSELGSRMADGLNAAIDEIDFYTAGQLFVRKFTALLDLVDGFLRDLDYHDLGKAIGDYFRGALDEATVWLKVHDWSAISATMWENIKAIIDGFNVQSFAQRLGDFITTAANSAADFLNGLDFTDVVNTVTSTIATFFDNLHTDEIKTAIGNLWEAIKTAFKDTMTTFGEWLRRKNEDGAFAQAGKDFNEGIKGFLADLKELSGYVPWDELGTAIGDFMKEIEWKEIFLGVWESVKPYFEAAVDWFFGEESGYLGEKVIGLKLAFDMAGPVLSAVGQAFVLKILNPFKGLGAGIAAAGTEAGTAAVGIGTKIAAAAPFVGTAALGVADAVLVTYDVAKLSEAANGYNTAFNTHLNEISTSLGTFEKLYSEKGSGIAAEWAKAVYGIDTSNMTLEEGQKAVAEEINKLWKDTPQSLWEGFKAGWNDYFGEDGKGLWQLTKDAFSSFVKSVRGFFGIKSPSTVFKEIGNYITIGLIDGIKEKWSEITDYFAISVPQVVGNVKTVWGELKENASEIWGNVKDSVFTAWENVKENTSATWNNVKTSLSTTWDSLKETADTSFSSVKKTVTGATGDITRDSTSDTQTLYDDVTGIYNNIHSEAVRIFSDIARNVPTIMNYMAQQVQESAQQMGAAFEEMSANISNAFENMRLETENSLATIQTYTWSLPEPEIPHIEVYFDTIFYGNGRSMEVPRFNVQWYAKGGILDNPTLFGMGDAGAEALVPLERNTEWIGKVAAEMNRQSAKNEDRNESNDDVIDALYTICDRIIRAIPDGGDDVDMDSLARSITKMQRRQARAMG